MKSFGGLSQYLEKYKRGDSDVISTFLYMPAVLADMMQGKENVNISQH